MTQFRAHVYFSTEDEPRCERLTTIQFLSLSRPRAALDVERWFYNRNLSSPEHFHKLLAVRLCLLNLVSVDDDGYLREHYPQVFEWKYDWPGTYEQWVFDKLGAVS